MKLELADLLLAMRVKRLDMDVIQGPERQVTQAIARALFKAGAAGITYHSKYDNELCLALFESRAQLMRRGEPRSLMDPCPEFDQVCREFDLGLEPVPAL